MKIQELIQKKLQPLDASIKYYKNKKKRFSHHIEGVLRNQSENLVTMNSFEIKDPLKTASTIGFLIAKKLERNSRFPRIRRELFDQVAKSKYIEGIRISCSGSLKGGKMARTYTYKMGPTSLHTFSKKIDYDYQRAITKYGTLGVKVWLSYKEGLYP